MTTVKIADSAVTTAKIADSAVTTAKIADDAVSFEKLAPAVRDKIADNMMSHQDNAIAISNLDNRVGRNEKKIEENEEGVALALAIPATHILPNGKTYAVSGKLGYFEGSNALGFGATGRLHGHQARGI